MRRLATLLFALSLAGCQARTPRVNTTTYPAPTVTAPAPTTSRGTGLFFDDFDMVDRHSGWAWKGISQLYRTDDGGETWQEIHLQGRRLAAGASFLSGKQAWLPGVPDSELKQDIYHTSDGGMTWAQLGSVAGPNAELQFLDDKRGWALNGVGAAGNVFYQVYRTTDGGATWAHVAVAGRAGTDQGPMAGTIHVATGDSVSFSPPDSIWIASGSGVSTRYAGLAVSPDGGKSWRDVNPSLPFDLVKDGPPVTTGAPQFTIGSDAFLPVIVGHVLVVFASHDGGESWALLPPVLPSTQMAPRVQFVNSRDGFADCGERLCSTGDGGQTWQQIPTPFPFGPSGSGAFVLKFDFVDGLAGWAMLVDQQGSAALLKTIDGGRTWIRMAPRLGF